MIDEIAGGIIKFIARIIAEFLLEVVGEIFIKGPGYFILKKFKKTDLDPDSAIVAITGVIFWLVTFSLAYYCYYNLYLQNS